MMETNRRNTTPGGNQSTVAKSNASKSLDSGELATTCSKKSEIHENVQQKIKHKDTNFFATRKPYSLPRKKCAQSA